MIERATAIVRYRPGTEPVQVAGYAFSLEKACWFFVPDVEHGRVEHLFGRRVSIVMERGSGSRAGRPARARVLRLETVRVLAARLREMMEGL